jgi:hypothetical protein
MLAVVEATPIRRGPWPSFETSTFARSCTKVKKFASVAKWRKDFRPPWVGHAGGRFGTRSAKAVFYGLGAVFGAETPPARAGAAEIRLSI